MADFTLEDVREVIKDEIGEALTPLAKQVQACHYKVFGNGNPSTGLLIRTEKLEAAEVERKAKGQKALATRERVIWALMVAVIGLASGWVKDHLPVGTLADAAADVAKESAP